MIQGRIHIDVRGITRLICCVALLFSALSLGAQDLETIGEQKFVTVNGGISANNTFYYADGIPNRRDPYYWLLNANLNFNFLGIVQAPFSMTISQQQKTFAQPQPFNRFGISPTYKAFTAHLGHRTMQFSEYTLGGNMFLGAGVEWNDLESPIRVSMMYGRLAKAVQRSAQQGLVFAEPTFRRTGYGIKVGLGRKKHMIDLILFRASDDPSSIEITDEVQVTPEDNLVTSLHGKHELTDRIAVEFEYAYSLFTRDSRALPAPEPDYSFFNNLGGLFKPNISSEFNKAFTGSVLYSGSVFQANLKYRKIDPGYRSLGSAFLNNGMKDLTGGVTWSMLKQQVSMSLNAGIQENDDEVKVVRGIYSVGVNYNSERINASGNYSNFSTSTRQSQIQRDVFTDTLEYLQVTRNGALMISFALGNKERPTMLSLTANAQDAQDNASGSNRFLSLSLGAQKQIVNECQAGLTATLNESVSTVAHTRSMGPVLNVTNAFLKGQIRSALSVAALNSYANDKLQGKVYNLSCTNTLKILKKHSVAMNVYYLINETQTEGEGDFKEVRAMINYNFSF